VSWGHGFGSAGRSSAQGRRLARLGWIQQQMVDRYDVAQSAGYCQVLPSLVADAPCRAFCAVLTATGCDYFLCWLKLSGHISVE
jgi:hypothetical protein